MLQVAVKPLWGRPVVHPEHALFGRLNKHLAKVRHTKSDVRHCCIGGLSRRVHGSGQPTRWWAAVLFAAGGCAPVCRPRHVRRAARDSGCTIGGAVPEVGRPAAHISESVVWPPARALAAVWRPSLWAARSAIACPGCPWGGAAWHGGCALISRWWSAPAAPTQLTCRGSRFDSSCRAPWHGATPLLLWGVGLALSTLAASPPPPSPTPTPRRRDTDASSTADAADADVVALAAVTVTVATPPIDAADADAAPTTGTLAVAAAAAAAAATAAAAVAAVATAPVAAADADAPPRAPYPAPVPPVPMSPLPRALPPRR
jgi:hypothetical protein